MKNVLWFCVVTVLLQPLASAAADKVVVVPLKGAVKAGDGRIWGEGRNGSGVMTMQHPGGSCEMPSGIRYSLSSHLSTWNSAPSVCPSQTWVCRESDIAGETPCSPPTGPKDIKISCAGITSPLADPLFLHGWLSDAGSPTSQGRYMTTDSINGAANDADVCISYNVWCCWQ